MRKKTPSLHQDLDEDEKNANFDAISNKKKLLKKSIYNKERNYKIKIEYH